MNVCKQNNEQNNKQNDKQNNSDSTLVGECVVKNPVSERAYITCHVSLVKPHNCQLSFCQLSSCQLSFCQLSFPRFPLEVKRQNCHLSYPRSQSGAIGPEDHRVSDQKENKLPKGTKWSAVPLPCSSFIFNQIFLVFISKSRAGAPIGVGPGWMA